MNHDFLSQELLKKAVSSFSDFLLHNLTNEPCYSFAESAGMTVVFKCEELVEIRSEKGMGQLRIHAETPITKLFFALQGFMKQVFFLYLLEWT